MKTFKTFFITVLGKDQKGIIADVTRAAYGVGCNLEDISMTILEDQFCMVMVARFPSKKAIEKTESEMIKIGKKRKLSIAWYGVAAKRKRANRKQGFRYLVSAFGKDRTGIVAGISEYLSKKGMNITDLNSQVLESKKGDVYALVLEFESKKRLSSKSVLPGLQRVAKKLKVEINLRPVEEIEF